MDNALRFRQLPVLKDNMERLMRIELTTLAWKANVLPLNYNRIVINYCGKKANKYYNIKFFLNTLNIVPYKNQFVNNFL